MCNALDGTLERAVLNMDVVYVQENTDLRATIGVIPDIRHDTVTRTIQDAWIPVGFGREAMDTPEEYQEAHGEYECKNKQPLAFEHNGQHTARQNTDDIVGRIPDVVR